MLVSKIKPCMCKYEQIQTGSIPEREPEKRLPHQGRQQARKLPNPDTGRASLVPAAAVCTGLLVPSVGDALLGLNWPGRASGAVTLKKLECSKQAYALTPLAPYEKSKFLGSGGSMVARLKLKGIDGRAPPGVEPAA
ncbi:hypothetical protein L1887_61039 [Cichorium endivia]|nr:hypothetical protein L1887_61039 [Cichorium endivia]